MTASTSCVPMTTTSTCCGATRLPAPGSSSRSRNFCEERDSRIRQASIRLLPLALRGLKPLPLGLPHDSILELVAAKTRVNDPTVARELQRMRLASAGHTQPAGAIARAVTTAKSTGSAPKVDLTGTTVPVVCDGAYRVQCRKSLFLIYSSELSSKAWAALPSGDSDG
jgi:hypothetical protein